MAESRSHKQGKGNAKKTEVPISGGRRLDAIRGNNAIEVERSGSTQGISAALSRLKTQVNKNKILRVPQPDMKKATSLARAGGMNVTITNLGKTRRTKS